MRFVVYQDLGGGYRWRLVARNGRIVADSGESYVEERGARESVLRITQAVHENDYVVLDHVPSAMQPTSKVEGA